MTPLRLLPQKEFMRLCAGLVVEEKEAGQFLFQRGEHNTAWIYLIEGEVSLECDGLEMERIRGGSVAAQFPLAHQVPRKISARALTKLRYISFDQQSLDAMEHTQETTETKLASRKTSKSGDWMSRLFKLPVFQNLPASNLHRILQRFEEVPVTEGQRVIEQGAEAECVYILSKGRCKVTRRPRPNAKEFKLGDIQVGDMFGEDALISGLPRAVSVTMEEDGTLQRLQKQDFMSLVVEPVLTQISLETALREVEQGALWLDVRDPDSYQANYLEESSNIPFFSLRMQLGSLDRHLRYVTVCDNGRLSAAAAFLLLRYGFEASVLEGGLDGVPAKWLQKAISQGEGKPAKTKSAPSRKKQIKVEEQSLLAVEEVLLEPVAEVPEPRESVSPDPALIQAFEAEKQSLERQIRELQLQLTGMEERHQSEIEVFSKNLEALGSENEKLKQRETHFLSQIEELEVALGQSREAVQPEEGEESLQALQAELDMVREQAAMDISAVRAELELSRKECELLREELSQAGENLPAGYLPKELQAIDPEDLPLQPSDREHDRPADWRAVVLQGGLWVLVGILAGFSLVGMGLQTDAGKQWLLGWLQVDGTGYHSGQAAAQGHRPLFSGRLKTSPDGKQHSQEGKQGGGAEAIPQGDMGAAVFSDPAGGEELFGQ